MRHARCLLRCKAGQSRWPPDAETWSFAPPSCTAQDHINVGEKLNQWSGDDTCMALSSSGKEAGSAPEFGVALRWQGKARVCWS